MPRILRGSMLNIPIRVSAMVILVVSGLMASPTFSSRSYTLEAYETKVLDSVTNFSSTTIDAAIVASSDNRSIRLRKFLRDQGSPMQNSADELVKIADKHGLDWKMLPAIAGVESTFGQFIPSGSFNAYGWHNGRYYFSSWTDASTQVAAGINDKWGHLGRINPWKIGPSYAENPAWASRVVHYMNIIGNSK